MKFQVKDEMRCVSVVVYTTILSFKKVLHKKDA